VCAAFLCLHFRFVLYWRKPTGAKAGRRKLMKFSPGDIRYLRDCYDALIIRGFLFVYKFVIRGQFPRLLVDFIDV
jgi:hypothetical protein